MKVIDPGHVYQLDWLDVDPNAHLDASTAHALGGWDGTDLVFVKREGPGYPGNVGRHPGTNMQEVLRALIDRVKYLDNQIPDVRNGRILDHLRLAIYWLEQRAAERHNRPLMRCLPPEIELFPTCEKCGHIACERSCYRL